jgi:hypothetical protein
MSSPDRPLLAELQDELRGLTDDAGEMFRLRWELARVEFESALKQIKRLAVILAVAIASALTGLPLLISYLAETLDGWHEIARKDWLLIFGLTLLVLAILGGYGGWLCFRRRFTGLQESFEELREDLQCVKELMEKPAQRQS